MIQGGNVTLYVRKLDVAVAFYSGVLGLSVDVHAPGHFALLSAGPGLTIGLHPAGPKSPPPGESGSVLIGLKVRGPIEDALELLRGRGVSVSGPIRSDGPVRIVEFADPDGHRLYLCEESSGARGSRSSGTPA